MPILKFRWLQLSLISLGLILLLGGSGVGQETYSPIQGTVKDATGAIVAGVTIALPELPASQFAVKGGSRYLNENGRHKAIRRAGFNS